VPISSSNEKPAATTIGPGPNGLTVSFEIRYLGGDEGDRIAALQAEATYALLSWLAHCDNPAAAE
jgi:hypothetical protein